MERLEITGINLDTFDKRLEMALSKAYRQGVEDGKTQKKDLSEYLDKSDLMDRWKCSDDTILNYEKKYREHFWRTPIGGMIRYRRSVVESFERLIENQFNK